MSLTYEIHSSIGDISHVNKLNSKTFVFDYPCEDNTKCTPYDVHLTRGFYKFEVWGAQGGSSYWSGKFAQKGGRGGYSVGLYHTFHDITLYIYIGGKGTDATATEYIERPGGYNGGGQGGTDSSKTAGTDGGGGGGTDIRLRYENIHSRLIVAGGGASGDSDYYDINGYGASGGGEEGETIVRLLENNKYSISGTGGKQSEGGKVNKYGRNAVDGSFFYGGNGSTGYLSNGGGAGGGGYYGGAGGTSFANHNNPTGSAGLGGGGSGYIGGVTELLRFHFKKETIKGSASFPKPHSLTETEEGHLGHGACRITILTDHFCKTKNQLLFSLSFFLLSLTLIIIY